MTTITLTDRLYAKLKEMADKERTTVHELIRPWVEELAALDEEGRKRALRFARLRREHPESEWVQAIDTLMDRAELPER